MNRRHFLLASGAAVGLAGCGAGISGPDASAERVASAAYRGTEAPELILYTMKNNRTGNGAHTSLLIRASQTVVFDPAGSVRFNAAPEVGDVLYGITPTVQDFYERAHARSTYHVVIQSVKVPAATAEKALQLAQARGNVGGGFCTNATSAILAELPGFESIKVTLFPNNLMAQFAKIPGVTSRKLFENDADDKTAAIAEFDALLQAGQ